MINFALFSALAAFYFTMFVTPGPNNAMLTASGMKFGFIKDHFISIYYLLKHKLILNQFIIQMEGEQKIDTDLYSRQIGTFGIETMGKLIKMNVVI